MYIVHAKYHWHCFEQCLMLFFPLSFPCPLFLQTHSLYYAICTSSGAAVGRQ